jgi:hypothetical protein
MENKQTAVEWLVYVVQSNIAPNYIPKEIVEQAKEMDLGQKQNMFDCGRQYQLTGEGTFTEVYNETYGCQTN